jgi:hypothetical protein
MSLSANRTPPRIKSGASFRLDVRWRKTTTDPCQTAMRASVIVDSRRN